MRQLAKLSLVILLACDGPIEPAADVVDGAAIGSETRAMHSAGEIICAGDITGVIKPHLDAGESVLISAGTCDVTETLTLRSNVTIQGAGPEVTSLRFTPPAGGPQVFIRIERTASPPVENVTLRDLALKSPGAYDVAKTAVYVHDARNFTMENVVIFFWASDNQTTTGIELHGREFGTFRKVRVEADVPLRIGLNDRNSASDLDHHHFKDINLRSLTAADPVVTVEAGAVLRNITFDGYQEWRNGGLRWVDGTTVPRRQSSHLRLSNIRFEGLCADSACDPMLPEMPWAIDIQKNPGTMAVPTKLEDLWVEFSLTGPRGKDQATGAPSNGVRAIGVSRTVLSQVVYEGTGTAVEPDPAGQVILDPPP